MIVSTWAVAIGTGSLVAAGLYIMTCHNFMNKLMHDNHVLVAILEQIKEQLNED